MLEPLAPRALVGQALPMPDPEVRERPVRRRFSAEYKRRIVEEANAAAEPPGPPTPRSPELAEKVLERRQNSVRS